MRAPHSLLCMHLNVRAGVEYNGRHVMVTCSHMALEPELVRKNLTHDDVEREVRCRTAAAQRSRRVSTHTRHGTAASAAGAV